LFTVDCFPLELCRVVPMVLERWIIYSLCKQKMTSFGGHCAQDHYYEFHYAEYHYAKYQYAECHYGVCHFVVSHHVEGHYDEWH
jgi:hypothetical protein